MSSTTTVLPSSSACCWSSRHSNQGHYLDMKLILFVEDDDNDDACNDYQFRSRREAAFRFHLSQMVIYWSCLWVVVTGCWWIPIGPSIWLASQSSTRPPGWQIHKDILLYGKARSQATIKFYNSNTILLHSEIVDINLQR